MTVIIACLIIAFLMLLSVPIAFSIGLGSVYYFLASGKPLMMIPQKMFTTVDNFTLLAIPLFIDAVPRRPGPLLEVVGPLLIHVQEPLEVGLVVERVLDETRQIDRAQAAAAVRR